MPSSIFQNAHAESLYRIPTPCVILLEIWYPISYYFMPQAHYIEFPLNSVICSSVQAFLVRRLWKVCHRVVIQTLVLTLLSEGYRQTVYHPFSAGIPRIHHFIGGSGNGTDYLYIIFNCFDSLELLVGEHQQVSPDSLCKCKLTISE